MKVSYQWLRELVEIELSPAELAEKLTAVGLPVEGLTYLGEEIRGVFVGKIVEVKPHPAAEHLFLCQVDVGPEGLHQIVSGAPNTREGLLAPVVLPGGTLPGGRRIEAVELRGARSEGMLCSAAELGLEKESTGLLELPPAAQPGDDVRRWLGLDDVVLEIELTTNRADCQSMVGVAREVAAITGKPLRLPIIPSWPRGKGEVPVLVEAPELCGRYAGYYLRGIKDVASPLWMQQRLRACGVRPISGVVDVTNYVMLEMNQPLHAFDLGKLAGRQVVVRRAREGERLVTLDGVERVLDGEMLVIADAEKPVAVAGVMGGANSEITLETEEVFLEGAWFNATGVRRTAKKLGLRTEASLRFERGIDPNGVVVAMNRAVQLLVEIGAAAGGELVADYYPAPVKPREILLRPERANMVLGTNLSVAEMAGYLQALPGMQVEVGSGRLQVTVPTYRRDLEEEVDLIEEIARLYGYDRIPVSLPTGLAPRLGLTPAQKIEEQLREVLVGAGFAEVITYSLTSEASFSLLRLASDDPRRQAVRLLQPLSEEQAVLRTMLWPSVLEVASRNVKRRILDLRLFELGRVFWPSTPGELPEERRMLAGLLMGRRYPRNWASEEVEVDFFDLKGIVERVLGSRGLTGTFTRTEHPSLHPGRCAQVESDGMVLGILGQVHPRVAAAFDIEKPVYIFELDVEKLLAARGETVQYRPLPRYPAISRDLAFVVKKEIPASEILAAVREAGGTMVEEVNLFDVYEGAPIEAGYKNVALSVVYRAPDRTLTDAEVNRVEEKIITAVGQRTGGRRRA